ncbi:MAG: hypothetical protein FD137_391 [Spirochaetes bacterium]|nr:MAG: hypothetical protein FD137_391 [Spirochaetota bacterium]
MRNLWSPESFQGKNKRRSYFEGWYFKQTAGSTGSAGSTAWSFIPGIAYGLDGEGYSFVQAIQGRTGRSWWFQHPLDAFFAAERGLEIRVGENRFSSQGLRVDLFDGKSRIEAEFAYGGFSTFRFPFWSPGVMGPFSFAPGMECNHGLVSMDHRVDGWVSAEGETQAFHAGRGYIEKDWGTSMPEAWIWTQSNDFSIPGDSVMLSVAKIPWMGASFRGFLCAAVLGGRKYLFTTYNRARIQELKLSDTKMQCAVWGYGGNGRPALLEIEATRTRGGILRAPVSGLLSRRISEAVDATLRVRLSIQGEPAHETASPLAGLEIAGEPSALGIAR